MSTIVAHLPSRWRAGVVVATGVLVIYALLFDQGLLTGGSPWLHELAHDARHLLGIPCH